MAQLTIKETNLIPKPEPPALTRKDLKSNFPPKSNANQEPKPDPPSSSHSYTMSSMSSASVSSNSSKDGHGLKKCVALYTYANQNMEESNISMDEGEEFWILNEDCDGCTHVRRCYANPANPDYGNEGFVPTTWIRLI